MSKGAFFKSCSNPENNGGRYFLDLVQQKALFKRQTGYVLKVLSSLS